MACGYAYAVLGDFHLARDASQEAFIEAYRCLGNLRDPAAFPGWFRRIVFKHCDRLIRRRHAGAVPIEMAENMVSNEGGAASQVEQREIRAEVLAAVRGLPEKERAATTLFYINGYSQSEVAEFLELPVGTVKSRLRAARKLLKERMMDMVGETLKQHAPDERFSLEIIEALLARPRLLDISDHPVRKVWDAMRAALSDYEVITGEEVETEEQFAAAEDHALDLAYKPESHRALRYQMTTVTMNAIRGRQAPVRLLAAGRVFRPDREDRTHSRIFHQVDGVCVERGADVAAFKATCERLLRAALPDTAIMWRACKYSFVVPGFELLIGLEGGQIGVLGGGMLKPDTLRRAGYDPDAVGGFAWGLSLERIAMAKYAIDDIRKLWQPPYVGCNSSEGTSQ